MRHYALQGDHMNHHFRENLQQLKEDITKKEKALNDRKEKLFSAKDTKDWELEV